MTALGCEEEVVMGSSNPAQAAPGKGADAGAEDGDGQKDTALPLVEFSEADFVESEDSRDPFRDFAHLFVKKTQGDRVVQRKVKASQFALDELRLVGIITRATRRVMLTDPTGYGWVLFTGDFVAKPELVSAGGTDGTEVAINWRIDRIRPKDVVFIREDAAHPEIPPTTRVMPLFPTEDEGRSGS
ncbi:MAG: pilus assembly protein PilP [Deltaproteobacteria bacterium]|nr:MAG: pilus assembly protein PilP [Deltaproteobacteria bacterium]